MLKITRKNQIKNMVLEKKSVLVSELAKQFNVTEETIRRDIKDLEKEGILTKTYGGAFINEGVLNDLDIKIREELAIDEKTSMAAFSANCIQHGDCIFLDASTTSLHIAKQLSEKRITIVTNSLKVAEVVSNYDHVTLFLIGGIYNHKNSSFVGKTAVTTMNNYFVDKAFISCSSVSMQMGLTDSNEQQAEIRSRAIERCSFVYLTIDHTKIDKTSFVTVGDFDKVSHLITDRPLSGQWVRFLKEKNIALSVVDGTNADDANSI